MDSETTVWDLCLEEKKQPGSSSSRKGGGDVLLVKVQWGLSLRQTAQL
jgi:hypothetical protein